MVLPHEARQSLLQLFWDGGEGITRVKRALCKVDSKNARATKLEDEHKVKGLIAETVGFELVDNNIVHFLLDWVAAEVQRRMKDMVLSDMTLSQNIQNVDAVTKLQAAFRGRAVRLELFQGDHRHRAVLPGVLVLTDQVKTQAKSLEEDRNGEGRRGLRSPHLGPRREGCEQVDEDDFN